ncbi:ATP-binding cassette domain-containing protein [Patescibacteria group bacterium]|nr:ATP-binding cassette domain-containing protein [Patescibacteria group bacterium]MCL5091326.1 ATP-binding cassette domain-containing protein [Patescibacteria group bacterium]
MIKASHISFAYTDSPLFQDGGFTVGPGMKAGLVGPNGAGKSTLLALICGKQRPDRGRIETTGAVALVPQEVKYDAAMETAPAIRAYIDPDHAHEDFQLRQMLAGLELDSLNLLSSPRGLSGGQKTKLALIRALLQEPDVLLLDEPTNFVDVNGKKWVAHRLGRYPKTLLLISHDLALMNKYIDKVIAIDPLTKTITEHNGNYTTYLTLKKQREELMRRKIISEKKHIVRMKKGLKKMDRYTSEKGVRQRTRLKKRIEALELALPPLPQEVRSIKFKLLAPARIGEVPIVARHIRKSYGNRLVLDDVSLILQRYERMILIGKNGVGKSTLIKILMGIIPYDAGEIVKDEKLKVGYYSQEFETFAMERTLIDTVYRYTEANDTYVRPLLARLLFRGDKIFQTVDSLSGGEKTRLALALLLLRDFNLLMLDEPTTYLDVMSQRVILEALRGYQGTILLVSHSRDFVKELKPTKALLLPENGLVDWNDDLLGRISEI